jgi:ubiquinone/menaquinone biosynthesis C-methylase UbiE
MAVNDFIEKDQGKPARTELEQLVFPRIDKRSVVCELGPGTGVYTRYISEAVTGGEFHVVDSDPNAIAFLRKHLPPNPAVRLHRNSGTELPLDRGAFVDLVFCASMFTGGNLSYFYRYVQEFRRVLKPGGWAVFDYFDVATAAGWTVLQKNMARTKPIFAYAYHATPTVDRMLDELGFDLVDRFPTMRGSVFVSARKR